MTTATITLASGCFWGTEYFMKRLEGVELTEVGYCGGHVLHPTYEVICTGKSGHYEVVRVHFDSERCDLKTLLKHFFETHDFSQADGQGPDIGPQYQSAIFVANQEEKQVATDLISQLRSRGMAVATKVLDAATFYPAENYHSDYYDRMGAQPSCHVQRHLF